MMAGMTDAARAGSPASELSSDGAAAEQAQREERFAAFVARHRAKAVGMAWRLVGGDAGAAEDVAQDAFVRAWRALPRFRGEASLETWFYRILVRRAADYRRWSGVRRRWASDADPDGAPSLDVPGDPGLQRRIAAALDTLSARQRECFVLVHLEGLTLAETAEVLRKPLGTVKSHLHRALAKLRGELADLGPAALTDGESEESSR
jgi:RNA polymerase sigma-70 factor (ECF subfamily)